MNNTKIRDPYPYHTSLLKTPLLASRIQEQEARIRTIAKNMGNLDASNIKTVISKDLEFGAAGTGKSIVFLNPSFIRDYNKYPIRICLGFGNKRASRCLSKTEKQIFIFSQIEKDFIYAHELAHMQYHQNRAHQIKQAVLSILDDIIFMVATSCIIGYVKSLFNNKPMGAEDIIENMGFPGLYTAAHTYIGLPQPSLFLMAYMRSLEKHADLEAAKFIGAEIGIQTFQRCAAIFKKEEGIIDQIFPIKSFPVRNRIFNYFNKLLKIAQVNSWLASHPSFEQRINYLRKYQSSKLELG
ncbi:MAG: hypothetical protein K0S74_987 [Chlamydiales bacterium]|jgi:hypothetical protein|nr:hypothetical protein [Chlamydiales bacterium]